MSFSTLSKSVIALNPDLKKARRISVPDRPKVRTVSTVDPLLPILPVQPTVATSFWRTHLAAQDKKLARAAAPGSEHRMQVALIQWSQAQVRAGQHVDLGLLFAVPNGGKRNARTAAMLRSEGVRSGVSDLILPVPRGVYHGAFLELKLPSNQPTESQEAWLDVLEHYGYKVAVAMSLAVAKEFLTGYLTL